VRSYFFIDRSSTQDDGSLPNLIVVKGDMTGPPAGPVGKNGATATRVSRSQKAGALPFATAPFA
jgi:hypothetical protein